MNFTNSFREIESFIYLKPMLRYALYDATIQGSFLNKKSLVTKELIPLVFELELGIKLLLLVVSILAMLLIITQTDLKI